MMKNPIYISSQDIANHIKLSSKFSKTLNEITNRKVIESTAREVGIKVDQKELQQAADNFRINHQLYNAKETWSWLYKNHLSLNDFKDLVYANALAEQLARYLFAEKVDSWYKEHQLDYAIASIYEMILEEELAIELFCKLQEQQIYFYEITSEWKQAEYIANWCGYLGFSRSKVTKKVLKPKVAVKVFSASPPQILQPIKTNSVTHLILVEEFIQPKLNDQLRAQIISDLFTAWLKEKIKEIQIKPILLE